MATPKNKNKPTLSFYQKQQRKTTILLILFFTFVTLVIGVLVYIFERRSIIRLH